jgi:hypothetical protein
VVNLSNQIFYAAFIIRSLILTNVKFGKKQLFEKSTNQICEFAENFPEWKIGAIQHKIIWCIQAQLIIVRTQVLRQAYLFLHNPISMQDIVFRQMVSASAFVMTLYVFPLTGSTWPEISFGTAQDVRRVSQLKPSPFR